jgi:hypothetical protein
MERTATLARWAALPIVVCCLTGCGGNDKPAVCSDVDALHTSMDDLKNVEVSRAGMAELKDDLAQVGSGLRSVKADAEQRYAAEIDAVEQAYSTLTSDVSAAATSPSTTAIAQVGADVHALGASLTALTDAVDSTC